MATDDERRHLQAAEGGLGLILCEYLWDKMHPLRLGGKEYEVAYCEDVPGYEEEDSAVLLRRKSDGKVFEADIDVTLREAREASGG